MQVLVAGAGGFIGGHLVKRLLDDGNEVKAVDIKPAHMWWQIHPGALNHAEADLRTVESCVYHTAGQEWVFNLAADMGGMGFIETHKLGCMLSTLINTHMLMACARNDVRRYFFSSSACVYPARLQSDPSVVLELSEDDAYPAEPEDGYGWEKLFAERMCRHFHEETDVSVRVARYHNVYGPHGTWTGGREKAPAALCRKVAEATAPGGNGEVNVWGDGSRQRSYTYIDDCVQGTMLLMQSQYSEPLNIGSDVAVSVNELLTIIEGIADATVTRTYDPSAPLGVAARNSNNDRCKQVLGWAPGTPLHAGLQPTYEWIREQCQRSS